MISISPSKLRRMKAMYALQKLPTSIRSAVLADGELARVFGISLERPVHLGDVEVVSFEQLVGAFRKIVDGKKGVKLTNQSGTEVDAKLNLASDGAMIVELPQHRFRFNFASLLATKKVRRLAAFDEFASRFSLPADGQAQARARLSRSKLDEKAFVETVDLFSASPELFAEELRVKAEAREDITREDFFPEHCGYWDALIPAPREAGNLSEYVAAELTDEWRRRLGVSPGRAIQSLIGTCASARLTPVGLLSLADPDDVAVAITDNIPGSSPYALVGMFEVCASLSASQGRFADLSERLLVELVGDMNRLENSCRVYAAAFVVTTAYLAQHEILRERPAYWRRIAAAAHASAIFVAFAKMELRYDQIVPWAMRLSGNEFVVSVFLGFFDQPLWRPEWIDPRYLVADMVGRTLNAVHTVRNHGATKWKPHTEKARAAISERGMEFAMFLPSLLEGERKAAYMDMPAESGIGEKFHQFCEEPSMERFHPLTDVLMHFNIPRRGHEAIKSLLEGLRGGSLTSDKRPVINGLSTLSQIAARDHDTSLAESIANAVIELSADEANSSHPSEAAWRIIECAGAQPTKHALRAWLAEKLERLAFAIPAPPSISELPELILMMRAFDPALGILLARAGAAARLARS